MNLPHRGIAVRAGRAIEGAPLVEARVTLRAGAGDVKLTRAIFLSFQQIEERAVGDVVVLDLKGKITLGEGDELLRTRSTASSTRATRDHLNLADVPYIDSAGLGEVVRTYTTVSGRAAASAAQLTNASPICCR